MNRILALSGALLLSGGTALAGDASLYSKASAYDWTGFWVGAHAGYVAGSLTGYSGATSGPSGADVGLHAYYNWQRGNWVFGPYLGVPLVQKEGTASGGGTSYTTTAEWAVTGGFRLGYAIDRWLPYGVVGGIVAGGTTDGPVTTKSNTHTGYALVLGVDYAMTDRIALGARYAHVSMSKENYGSGAGNVGWDGDSVVGTLTFKLF